MTLRENPRPSNFQKQLNHCNMLRGLILDSDGFHNQYCTYTQLVRGLLNGSDPEELKKTRFCKLD